MHVCRFIWLLACFFGWHDDVEARDRSTKKILPRTLTRFFWSRNRTPILCLKLHANKGRWNAVHSWLYLITKLLWRCWSFHKFDYPLFGLLDVWKKRCYLLLEKLWKFGRYFLRGHKKLVFFYKLLDALNRGATIRIFFSMIVVWQKLSCRM